ncbi:Ricin-type beta-trefoil lectin domain protein [Streptomyces sp. S4.7]|nr:Ricin-type beta-trefoil lectin domain protein [Streptomyces sp. S4.7]
MTLDRRHFLGTGALAIGGAGLGPMAPTAAAVAPARGGWYTPNAAPLAPTAFQKLPLGSVTPRGWLTGQLRLLLDGLFGRYAEVSHFLRFDDSGWVHPEKAGWEEVTYWLRGYVDLAALTGDPAALDTARRWIDAIIATRQPDGFFGPTRLRTALNGAERRPGLLAVSAAAPGAALARGVHRGRARRAVRRAVPALHERAGSRRLQLQLGVEALGRRSRHRLLALQPHRRVVPARPRGQDAHPRRQLGRQLPRPHNVNIAQGFREPAQYALRTGSAELTRATYRSYAAVMGAYGQFPGGGFAGDENSRPGFDDPRQGFETCGTVEFMASHELLTRITGDPVWADRCEELAFNLLPAATDPHGRGIHYITSANGVELDNTTKNQGQFQNGFAMQAYKPGIDTYRCCPHNYGMGWPYFTEELWLATPDRGLAAAMYAPSQVRAKVADGTEITVTEDTDYPFKETVTLTVNTPGRVTFPLHLRIPGWCADPRLTVAGRRVAVPGGPRFFKVTREWRDGDRVTLRLPQRTTVRTWDDNHGSVSVDHGPLTYSLEVGERYERFAGTEDFPELSVHPTTPWNVGLAPDPLRGLRFTADDGPLAANPFTHEGSPVRITTSARRIEEWVADDQRVVAPLQDSPARSTAAPEPVTLIPMGAARLRITAFPTASPGGRAWTAEPPYRRIRNKHSGKVLGVEGMSLDAGGRVVQFDNTGTADHAWQLSPAGGGWFLIRNGNSGKIIGAEGGSTANSARVVQFEDDGSGDHLWQLVDRGEGWSLILSRHSGKVLGVDGMSTANSAQVVQFEDNGTDDHLWQLV